LSHYRSIYGGNVGLGNYLDGEVHVGRNDRGTSVIISQYRNNNS